MKNKFYKGDVVLIQENGVMTNFETNLSHDIEVEVGDIFTIKFNHSEIKYKVVNNIFPLVAEEINPKVISGRTFWVGG